MKKYIYALFPIILKVLLNRPRIVILSGKIFTSNEIGCVKFSNPKTDPIHNKTMIVKKYIYMEQMEVYFIQKNTLKWCFIFKCICIIVYMIDTIVV